ncbi:epoxyqueuosine reductase QueH [Geomesophilobacter sediminis]|uniref:Epoxyqueuosine reductase QueH n=1 Tax=Geomesophilobacter sediminis TaxID=2798584 RepID=A0A8J7M401_9BACT|nr:epoxyqueuosine reductase QueH [Geomesophilobacter sediminis]MBJ6727683.1 epoxyqueuosine reductase QueH [Geomesophilobacter sediminis]
MKLLLHMCCAPCSIYPVRELRFAGVDVTGYFYNHNIHPYTEFRSRLDAVKSYAEQIQLEVVIRKDYQLEEFLGAVAADPKSRCGYCYRSRLEETARAAAEMGFTHFSSSLLYSRYQQHEAIKAAGEEFGARYGVQFHYDDYRRGWQAGIDISKEMGLYRQKYCGCIYSEKERYYKGK